MAEVVNNDPDVGDRIFKTTSAAEALLVSAQALEAAGAYALVLEGLPSDVADVITRAISIPTIGIGAGPSTDGQVLVCYDLLGMYRGLSPKFVKHFAEIGEQIEQATATYVADVRGSRFPGPEHCFAMQQGEKAPELTQREAGDYGPTDGDERS